MSYTVWGGYASQDTGDHWGTFRTREHAEAYRSRQLALVFIRPGPAQLVLRITEDDGHQGPWCDWCGVALSCAPEPGGSLMCSHCSGEER